MNNFHQGLISLSRIIKDALLILSLRQKLYHATLRPLYIYLLVIKYTINIIEYAMNFSAIFISYRRWYCIIFEDTDGARLMLSSHISWCRHSPALFRLLVKSGPVIIPPLIIYFNAGTVNTDIIFIWILLYSRSAYSSRCCQCELHWAFDIEEADIYQPKLSASAVTGYFISSIFHYWYIFILLAYIDDTRY